MSPQFASALYVASTWIIPLVIAITFHEASHGYVARLCGDDTAWRLGRVSFNPLKHIDPLGTILLPALLLLMRSPILFGYAKPVPVNFRALHNQRRREPVKRVGLEEMVFVVKGERPEPIDRR
jgi:Zn-dependent protease